MLLSVDLSWDRMAWAVQDPERSLWVALGSRATGKLQLPGQLLDKIAGIVQSDTLLTRQYRKVQVLWSGLAYTLIPAPLVIDTEREEYLRFTNTVHAGEEVSSDLLPAPDAVCLFSIPSILKAGLEKIWPGHVLHHGPARLAGQVLQGCLFPEHLSGACLCISAQSFALIITKDGKLQYCNSFEYRTADELLYYILYTYEQLGYEPGRSPLLYTGELQRPSLIIDYLEKYFATVGPAQAVCHTAAAFRGISLEPFYQLLNPIA
jgi:hypothetical protein